MPTGIHNDRMNLSKTDRRALCVHELGVPYPRKVERSWYRVSHLVVVEKHPLLRKKRSVNRLEYPGECCRASVGITTVRAAKAGVVQSSCGGNLPQGTGLDGHPVIVTTVSDDGIIRAVVDKNLHLRASHEAQIVRKALSLMAIGVEAGVGAVALGRKVARAGVFERSISPRSTPIRRQGWRGRRAKISL